MRVGHGEKLIGVCLPDTDEHAGAEDLEVRRGRRQRAEVRRERGGVRQDGGDGAVIEQPPHASLLITVNGVTGALRAPLRKPVL